MEHVELQRRGMVAHIAGQVRDQRVLDAMSKVPRDLFVPEPVRVTAYADRPLPIGKGQTISQPLMVAIMLEALELGGDEVVLDVGTGSGYAAALLSCLAAKVWSIEIVPELAATARLALGRAGADNVEVIVADGSLGWPAAGPYDAIVVAAASPRVPPALVSQLAEGGRLVLPVGERYGQQLIRIRRVGGRISAEDLGGCAFVPLVGEYGVDRRHWEAAQLDTANAVCHRAEDVLAALAGDLDREEEDRIAAAIRDTRAAVASRNAEVARDRAAVVAAWMEAQIARQ